MVWELMRALFFLHGFDVELLMVCVIDFRGNSSFVLTRSGERSLEETAMNFDY